MNRDIAGGLGEREKNNFEPDAPERVQTSEAIDGLYNERGQLEFLVKMMQSEEGK